MAQMTEQVKTPEKELNKIEIKRYVVARKLVTLDTMKRACSLLCHFRESWMCLRMEETVGFAF